MPQSLWSRIVARHPTRLTPTRWRALGSSGLAVVLALVVPFGVACTGDGGGGSGGDTGSGTGTGGAGDDGFGEPPLVCDEFLDAAAAAPPVPGCNGAVLGPPPELDPEDPTKQFLDSPGMNIPPYVLPGKMATTDPALVGAWSEVIEIEGTMPIHAIHRPTGRFLQFGRHNHGTGTPVHDHEAVWYPPSPCSPWEHGGDISQCEEAFDVLPGVAGIQSQHATPVASDLFCAGHINLVPRNTDELLRPRLLTVGGQLSAGGNNGINRAYRFWERLPDTGLPQSNEWDWMTTDDFNAPRWYPTVTAMANRDRSWVVGGVTATHTTCSFPDGSTGIAEACACDAQDPTPFVACRHKALYGIDVCDWTADDPLCGEVAFSNLDVEIFEFDAQDQPSWIFYPEALGEGVQISYPYKHVLPDLPHFAQQDRHWGGKILYTGAEVAGTNQRESRIHDPSGAAISSFPLGGNSCIPGSTSVQYQPGKFLKFGGGGLPSRAAVVLDLTDPDEDAPQWRGAGTTSMRRHFSSGVLLPDGSVIASGGTMRGVDGDPNSGGEINERYFTVYTTDLFDPDTETWCRLADVPALPDGDEELPTLRGYHSVSFLMRDGRMLLGAGGFTTNVDNHFNYQIYYPPYLFRGPRPEIDVDATQVSGYPDVPPGMQTGSTFTIDRKNQVPIERVTMIKLASSTHNWDMEQRFVNLGIEQNNGSSLVVSTPPSTCYATPGPYMLFALSDEGVPSLGHYVYVDGTCAAADVAAVPPPLPVVEVQAMNDRHAGALVVSSTALATIDLGDFRRSHDELCVAIGGCPPGSVALEANLVESTSHPVPQFLDNGALWIGRDGSVTVTDPLQVVVSGTGHRSAQLGPGQHVVELCGTWSSLTRCIRQPLHVRRQLAGPDGFGNLAGEIQPRFRRLGRVAHATKLPMTDDNVVMVTFPDEFAFPYASQLRHRMWVGANGGLRFQPGQIPPNNGPLGTGVGPHVAPFWDDLDPSQGGGVYVSYHGDRIIVSWENVPHKRGTVGGMSFQVHLVEDGRIEFHYTGTRVGAPGVADDGAGATVGIQWRSGAPHLTLSHDNDTWLGGGARGADFEIDDAVAGELWLPDNVPCDLAPRLQSTIQRRICGSPSVVSVPIPATPTTCRFDGEATMTGLVQMVGAPSVPVIHGRASVPAGQHTLEWQVRIPRTLHEGTAMYAATRTFTQTLEVTDVCQ
jgi:hypothetical protein